MRKFGRSTLAGAQAVAAFALGFFYMFCTFGNPVASLYGSMAITMIKHAILNGIRSQIEMKPVASLIFLLPIDILFGRLFPYPA